MPLTPIPAKDAAALIRAGNAPAGMRVRGRLNLSSDATLRELPPGLQATSLDLSDCTALRALPDDLAVTFTLDLTGCTALEALPPHLKVGQLIIEGCTALRALPEGLETSFLNMADCVNLVRWPERASVDVGRFDARNCAQLHVLPPWLTNLTQLNVRGCASLTALPETLYIHSWIDLADTQIRRLPEAARGAQLRWRGIPVEERIAFHPETITAQEILDEANLELRRVKLERMGYAAFLTEANAEVLDEDTDPGGPRRLLRLPLPGDEPLVCVAVFCPSTGRQYILRVPPTVETCRQAAAWIAGFDDPAAYRPLVET